MIGQSEKKRSRPENGGTGVRTISMPSRTVKQYIRLGHNTGAGRPDDLGIGRVGLRRS